MSRVGPILAVALSILCVCAPSLGPLAQDIREVRIESSGGESRITIKGRINGYAMDDYRIRAAAGERVVITLEADNPSGHFDVMGPDEADPAMFVGSAEGNQFEGDLPGSGRIAIRVYLARNAARRGEAAHYTLKMTVAAAGGVSVESGP